MTDAADQPAHLQHSVTIWETIAIALAGVSLMAIGTAGLVYKFFSNAANPQRATLIARSLMDYQIPGVPREPSDQTLAAQRWRSSPVLDFLGMATSSHLLN